MGEVENESNALQLASAKDLEFWPVPLSHDLMSSVLVFLSIRELLEWRAVTNSTKRIWASSDHVLQVARRLRAELLHGRELLKHVLLLKPSPRISGDMPMAHRDVPPSRWRACLNIGHKGANGHAKGNTMASYIKAVRLGVDVIEFDVLTTVDGVVICHHNPLVEETGEWIQTLTLAQVRKRFAHNVSTFEEMLQEEVLVESGVHLYVDMKHTAVVRQVMHMLTRAIESGSWAADRIIVASFRQFDLLQVNAFRRAKPKLSSLRTACIMDGNPLTLAQQFEALGVDAVSMGKGHVSPDLVADCQRRGIQLWAWTVNNVHMMEYLLKMGVDGLCSDFPDRVQEAIEKFRPQRDEQRERRGHEGRRPVGAPEPRSTPVPVHPDACVAEIGAQEELGGCRPNGGVVLGGWYDRNGQEPPLSERPEHQRFLSTVYGDLGPVRDLLVEPVQSTSMTIRACRFASASSEALRCGEAGWGAAGAELMGAAELCREMARATERLLRPIVESPRTWRMADEFLSSEQGSEVLARLKLSMEEEPPQPMLHFEKAFVKDLLRQRKA